MQGDRYAEGQNNLARLLRPDSHDLRKQQREILSFMYRIKSDGALAHLQGEIFSGHRVISSAT